MAVPELRDEDDITLDRENFRGLTTSILRRVGITVGGVETERPPVQFMVEISPDDPDYPVVERHRYLTPEQRRFQETLSAMLRKRIIETPRGLRYRGDYD